MKTTIAHLKALLIWIDSVPLDAALPAMPGFDRDDVDALVEQAESADVQEVAQAIDMACEWIACVPNSVKASLKPVPSIHEVSAQLYIKLAATNGISASRAKAVQDAHPESKPLYVELCERLDHALFVIDAHEQSSPDIDAMDMTLAVGRMQGAFAMLEAHVVVTGIAIPQVMCEQYDWITQRHDDLV
jgi:hypothetical protein